MSWCPGLLISHHRPGQARSRKRKCLTGNKIPLLCNRTGNARRRQTGGDRYKAEKRRKMKLTEAEKQGFYEETTYSLLGGR